MIDATLPGRRLVLWSWWGTAFFTLTAVAATILPSWFQWPALVVALALFVAGIITMLWAFFVAVERSRVDAIGVGGLYFGAGSAPSTIRRHFLTALAVQVIVGITTASIRVFTTLAFGTLVPLFAIGLTGLWCARHGEFEPTDPPDRKPDSGDLDTGGVE